MYAVATCVLSGGDGTASAGPTGTREVWSPEVVSVSVATNVAEATCLVYAGSQPIQSCFVDGTTWGSTGDSTSNFTSQVYPGQQVFAVWSGGDDGQVATLVIRGTRQIP